jgi:hypothetical protein
LLSVVPTPEITPDRVIVVFWESMMLVPPAASAMLLLTTTLATPARSRAPLLIVTAPVPNAPALTAVSVPDWIVVPPV